MFTNSFDHDFRKNFIISFGMHILLVLLSFSGAQVMSKIFKSNDVEIIRSSIRVDVVGMPKFTTSELKQMQAKPLIEMTPEVAKGVKEETKVEAEDVIKKDDLVIQEESKKKVSFLNLLNDYSSKKVAAKSEKKGITSGDASKKIDSLIIEGNRLSKGSALTGDYSDEQNSEFSSYVQSLPGIIRPFWKLPAYLLDKDLRCRIKIYISVEGKILKLELQESSGQSDFDSRAEQAVRAASFPRPSFDVGSRLTNSGIILGFPL